MLLTSKRPHKNLPHAKFSLAAGALAALLANGCDAAPQGGADPASDQRFADFEFTRWLSDSATGLKNQTTPGQGRDLDQIDGSCGGTAELTVTPASGPPLVFEADIEPYSVWSGSHCGQAYITEFHIAQDAQDVLALRSAGFRVPKKAQFDISNGADANASILVRVFSSLGCPASELGFGEWHVWNPGLWLFNASTGVGSFYQPTFANAELEVRWQDCDPDAPQTGPTPG